MNWHRKPFSGLEGEEGEYLRQFSFICLLSFDVYMKKQLIEKLIDQIPNEPDKKEKKEKK